MTRRTGDICLVKLTDLTRPFVVSCERPQCGIRPNWAARRYIGRMHALIESHREQLLSLARRRGITSVRVFGSMARDEARDDSDVDLLVTLPPGTSALALGGLLLDAQELLGRHVDVITEASLHPALRDQVLADAVAL